MELSNKVALVTGGGSGIGQQIVLALLNRGAIVAAVDVNPNTLQVTKELAGVEGAQLSLHQCDISDREAVSRLVDEVIKLRGCVDVIINNAGVIHPFKPVSELDYSAIDRVINVNLYGVINVTKAFLPLLLKRPVAHIVNVSSMGGLFAFPKQTLYGASKAAVKLFSEGLYSELRGSSVGVTLVFPGAINTDITKNSDSHDENLDRFNKFSRDSVSTSPESAANQIVKAIVKNKFRVHIGVDAKILGFLYRMFPTTIIVLLGKAMKIVIPD